MKERLALTCNDTVEEDIFTNFGKIRGKFRLNLGKKEENFKEISGKLGKICTYKLKKKFTVTARKYEKISGDIRGNFK